MNVILQIFNGSTIFEPEVLEGIKWTTERKNTPGKLTFECVLDNMLNIQEGNVVKLVVDDMNVFFGYIFTKNRSKNNTLSITAYDQLRYFKNKDSYLYQGMKASQVITALCDQFNVKYGNIDDTEYVIDKGKEKDKTLFDMCQNALDKTLLNTGKLYVLYDDFGRITLKNVANMKIGLMLDADTAQDFSYASSIDDSTYNQIKLRTENSETGENKIYIAKSTDSINQWGLLQYYETVDQGDNPQVKAEVLLKYYNKKSRKLSVKSAWGDSRVRAGVSPLVSLNLGDITVNNYMVCEKVTHTYKNQEHTMDLDLIGGEFTK